MPSFRSLKTFLLTLSLGVFALVRSDALEVNGYTIEPFADLSGANLSGAMLLHNANYRAGSSLPEGERGQWRDPIKEFIPDREFNKSPVERFHRAFCYAWCW